MSQPQEQRPFDLLQSIANRYVVQTDAVVNDHQVQGEWRGIGFSLGERQFVAPMAEVAEVLYLPPLTKVPGVKPWFRGLANIRGRLLTVIDLGQFLGLPSHINARESRVLVVQRGELYTGVLVDRISGMQVFDPAQQETSDMDGSLLDGYIEGVFVRGSQSWSIFSLFGLVESSGFLQVAV